ATTARLLAALDALAVLGAAPVELLAYLDTEGTEDPWVPAAVALALATLGASSAGEALVELAALLPASDEHVRTVGWALAWSPLGDGAGLAATLRAGKRPTLVALGLELGGRLGAVPASELEPYLGRGTPLEVCAAARVFARAPSAAVAGALERKLAGLWAAPELDPVELAASLELARALVVSGHRAPLGELRARPELAARLGAGAVELLALGGSLEDAGVLEPLLLRLPASEGTLDAVARLGHPGSWAYLAHYLDDPELAEAADGALRTLFGPLVPERLAPARAPWVRAIAEARLTAERRLRRGKRWSASDVAAACLEGAASAAAIAVAVDEIRAAGATAPDEIVEIARDA
ncbi:MAG: hypothetical protein HY908_28955, partial [Myxococcales bacterium]|nr:hypothetical protein [Myxococcales bacterium]